jgi:SAM-dependent methyltransferase
MTCRDPMTAGAQLDRATAPPNFDRLAGVYRWMEALSFGPWLWWCRCSFLQGMKTARRALIFGDGDGRFTARLLRENRAIEIDVVDASPAMLETLVKRAKRHNRAVDRHLRVHAHLADARSWLPPEGAQYDLVVTHFFLDCLTTQEVEVLAARVRQAVAEDATWVVSEFAIPPGRFGRLVARPLVGILYRAFGWMTGLPVRKLPRHALALERAGFESQERKSWLRGLLVAELWRCR